MANAKNISIEANGLQGDDLGRVLGYNTTTQGIYTPVVGTCERDSEATRINQEGNIEVVPANQLRVDWTNGVPEILLEPISTNLIQYSEDFSQSYWNKVNTTQVIPNESSIDGGNNAYILDVGTTDNDNRLLKSGASNTIGTFTFSIYAKHLDENFLSIRIEGGGMSSINNTYTLTDSWQRISVTYTTLNTDNVNILVGEQLVNVMLGSCYIFGAQLEELSYPTSYIKTNGAIATRQADSLTNFGSEQVIDSESGILFVECSALANDGTDRVISINNGSANRVTFFYDSSNRISYNVIVNNNIESIQSFSGYDILDNLKIAIKYASNDFSVYINGVLQYSDNSGNSFPQDALKNIDFSILSANFYGRIRQLKHLPFDTDITTL